MDLLFTATQGLPTKRCTMVLDIQGSLVVESLTRARPEEERETLADYAPALFGGSGPGQGPGESLDSWLDTLTPGQKTKLAVELAHSVPFPAFLKKAGFAVYRIWLRKLAPPA